MHTAPTGLAAAAVATATMQADYRRFADVRITTKLPRTEVADGVVAYLVADLVGGGLESVVSRVRTWSTAADVLTDVMGQVDHYRHLLLAMGVERN